MLDHFLTVLENNGYKRDESTEELFRLAFSNTNFKLIGEYKRWADDKISYTFRLASQENFYNVYSFMKGINLCSNVKPSFIIYTFNTGKFGEPKVPTNFITFFKCEDAHQMISFINLAIAENVLTK